MIKINEDYAVESDGKCVTLYNRITAGEKSKNPGEDRWIVLGYFNDFAHAALRLVDYSVKGAGSFEFMLEKMAQIKKDIDEVYKVFKGGEK